LDWQILWDTATGDIPELQRKVQEILDAEISSEKSDAGDM
jgi:uncharacterized protein with HEPN domain